MDPEKREWFDRLFEEAVMVPRGQQADFLADRCPDPALREELRSLLAFATETPFKRLNEAIEGAAAALEDNTMTGHRVGPYRVLSRIGVGGMGAVYRAARDDDEFQKVVAIKMLRFAYSGPEEVERLRRERQILATLEHPNIGRLLDGGTWIPPGCETKQPFLAMEYVEGLPLTEYCVQNRLNVRQRLELFRQVCIAVSYAHQHLVIHRDIKPANILVTRDGTPKLLDFGIAKLLETEAGPGEATATVLGLRAMTPDYASPEQVSGKPVSTLSDVYSLGVVLYEMLTGYRPHRVPDRDPPQSPGAFCEYEVDPPSTHSKRELRGDIDVIVLRAMQREPGRRYHSAEQLSEDVGRYLQGLPIVARPDTLAYRVTMFARRHRVGLVGAAAVFLALVGGIAASVFEATRAATAERTALLERDRALAEKQRADREAAAAKAVNEFLQNDLLLQAGASGQSQPDNKPDPDLKVRTALDRAAARIAGKFQTQPLVAASLRQTIGKSYQDLGLFPEAQREYEQSLELRRRSLGQYHESTLNVMNSLGELYWREGKYHESEELLTRLLELQRRVLGEDRSDTLKTMQDLAAVYEQDGNYPQSEALIIKVIEGRRRLLGPEHLETLNAMDDLALLYYDEGKYAQSEELDLQVLSVKRRVAGEEHPDVLGTLNNLGTVYVVEGKYAEADKLFASLVSVQRRVLGDRHPEVLKTMSNLGVVYIYEGKNSEAEGLLTRLVAVKRRVLGAENPDTAVTMANLAGVYFRQGKNRQAEQLTSKVLEIERRVYGPNNPQTLSSMKNLAEIHAAQKRFSEAEALLTETLAGQARALGAEHPATLKTMNSMGRLYQSQGQYSRAEQVFANTLRIRQRVLGVNHPDAIASLISLGGVNVRLQNYREAESLLRDALHKLEKSADSWHRYEAESLLGASLAGVKRYAQAEPLLLSGYAGLLRRAASIPTGDQTDLTEAGERIVRFYEDSGVPELAEQWRAKIRRADATGSPNKP